MKKYILIVSAFISSLTLAAQTNISDSAELVKIYNALGGFGWTNPWDLSRPVSTWAGVTLTGSRISKIDLSARSLTGDLGSIRDVNLPMLKMLYISNEPLLTGNLPNFSGFPAMNDLRIQRTGLNGIFEEPTHMPLLSNLYVIYNYALGGSVPAFTQTPELQVFQGYYNKFTTIASSYALPKLWRFDVKNQNFAGGGITGPIPDFSQSPNLSYLVLAQNKFTGTIDVLEQNTKLTDVLVFQNELSGSLPDFSSSPNLRVLYASENNFTGSIPNYTQNLVQLILYDNQLSGAIPPLSGTNFNTLQFLLLGNNAFTFADFEAITNQDMIVKLQDPAQNNFTYSIQTNFLLQPGYNSVDAVNAKGTLSKLTYHWYKRNADGTTTLLDEITGNSVLLLGKYEYNLKAGDTIFAEVTHSDWTVSTNAGKNFFMLSDDYVLDVVLPVTFDKIEAFIQNGQLFVNWSTLKELNNSNFYIEISKDGKNFKRIDSPILTKAPDGNSENPLFYSFSISLTSSLFMALPFLGLLIVTTSRKKRLLIMATLIGLVFTFYACNKKEYEVGTNSSDNIFVRIAQADKDGTIKYSRVIKAINK